jgi:hypothetical protein
MHNGLDPDRKRCNRDKPITIESWMVKIVIQTGNTLASEELQRRSRAARSAFESASRGEFRALCGSRKNVHD